MLILVAALAATAGYLAAMLLMRPAKDTSVTEAGRKILYYQSAMHPWIKSETPGNCTICGMKLAPVYEGEAALASDSNRVVLSTNAITVTGVRTSKASRQPLNRVVHVAGRFEAPNTARRVISAYVDGRIEQLAVNYPGMEVAEGQPLARIYSPALLTAEREYASLFSSGETLLQADREVLLDAARLRLQRLGLSPAQIDALPEKDPGLFQSEIVSPISGTVLEQRVFEGEYVREGDVLFTVADLSEVWFVFELYEQDLGIVQTGSVVHIQNPSNPEHAIEGSIAFIEPMIDPQLRSARARVVLENPVLEKGNSARRAFAHNAYAEGTVRINLPPALAVPRTAVLYTGAQPVVYVALGAGAYERREVRLGALGEAHWEVVSGVKEGEEVVTAGNLLIDAQAQINHGSGSPPSETNVEDREQQEHVIAKPLQEAQQKALLSFLHRVAKGNAALAADDWSRFKTEEPMIHAALGSAAQALSSSPEWAELVEEVREAAQWGSLTEFNAFRKRYAEFSTATYELAKAARASGLDLELLGYKCPMFPGPGQSSYWLQEGEPLRNPFYGDRMIDCGMEASL